MITGKIMPKFELGETVYYISRGKIKTEVTCSVCQGSGKLHIEDEVFSCPKCYSHGYLTEWSNEKWSIHGNGTIGRVEAIWYLPGYQHESEVRYMLTTTGIGSGTLHSEDRLFATYKDAQSECDKRNLEEGNDE
jgi:hypothetical protein